MAFNWLGLTKKASAANAALVRFFTTGRAQWTEVSYEAMAREGYRNSVPVFRSIDMVSKAVASIPLLVYERKGKKLIQMEGHPLQTLLDKPNDRQSGDKLRENIIAYYLLSGNSYIERVGPDKGPPKELYTHRPDRIKVVVGDSVNPIREYEYDLGGSKFAWKPIFIRHLKTFHPTDEWYGMAPLEAAARAVDINNSGKAWNAALLQNSGQPSGALVTEGKLTDEQFKRHKKQLREEVQGAFNAGLPLLLEAGMKWQQMSLTPAEVAWLEGLQLSSRDIATALGVPSVLIGDTDASTFANYSEARKALYQDTAVPLTKMLAQELTNWLAPLYGQNLVILPDLDSVEALQEDRTAKWERVDKAFTSGWLTMNETREAVGYEKAQGDEGDLYAWQIKQQPQQQQPNDQQRQAGKKAATTEGTGKSEEELKAAWQAYESKRDPLYSGVEDVVSKQFGKELEGLLKALESVEVEKAEEVALAYINKQAKSWATLINAVYIKVGSEFAEDTLDGLKGCSNYLETKAAKGWLAFITDYLKQVGGEKITNILETTRKQVSAQIQEGIAKQETMNTIAARVNDVYIGFTTERSKVIARTEVIGASNAGSYAAATSLDEGLKKTWVSTRDGRTRGNKPKDKHSHKAMDKQTMLIIDPFIEPKSKQKLLFPGDTSLGATAGNIIQCRCIVMYEEDEDA